MVIAALNLFGWTIGSTFLVSVADGLPKMAPTTAVLFLLVGSALLQQLRGRPGRWLPVIVLSGASLVLLCHAIHVSPSVLLPSPLTAAMFIMTGSSLLCSAEKRLLHLGQWLGAGVLLVSLLILAGYALRDTFLYILVPAQGTSIPTTISFALVSLAVLLLHPGEGLLAAISGSSPGAWAARRLLGHAVIVPTLLGLVCSQLLQLGWIDSGTALTLMVWGMGGLFAAMVWYFADQLHRIDTARSGAELAREEAMARLREADANKDEFLALIAHELRNPLAPVRSAADLLRISNDAEMLRRATEVIHRQVDHMTHLIDDLLDLSRVSRGLLELDKRPIDILAAVDDAIVQVAPLIEKKHHHLATDFPDIRPIVDGDHKRLVQVLANLLNNAAKYTPEGGVLRVQLKADEHMVEVSVQDNGIGIDPDLLPHVFDPFTQGHRRAGRADGGLGLGLALVRRLVELHHGTVRAESAGPGAGSSFIICLPRYS